jgi:hypothetical protein
MIIPRFNFNRLVIGDTILLAVAVKRDGAPLTLTGSTVFFTVKDSADQSDDDAYLAYKTGDGITQSGSTAEVHVPFGVTDEWPTDVDLVADIQVLTATGELFTAAIGTLRFRQHVTRRTS